MMSLHTKVAGADAVHDRLVLPYDQRERCRQRARLESGEEVALFLVRGTVLRDGDLLTGEDGRVVRVVAAPEPTYLVRCADATHSMRSYPSSTRKNGSARRTGRRAGADASRPRRIRSQKSRRRAA